MSDEPGVQAIDAAKPRQPGAPPDAHRRKKKKRRPVALAERPVWGRPTKQDPGISDTWARREKEETLKLRKPLPVKKKRLPARPPLEDILRPHPGVCMQAGRQFQEGVWPEGGAPAAGGHPAAASGSAHAQGAAM
eukprot:366420-Chlamydomonas_euryale.AAC.7